MQTYLLEMEIQMSTYIEEHLAPFLMFLVEFYINYPNVEMAILLNPRVMGGYLFILITTKVVYDGNNAVNANAGAI